MTHFPSILHYGPCAVMKKLHKSLSNKFSKEYIFSTILSVRISLIQHFFLQELLSVNHVQLRIGDIQPMFIRIVLNKVPFYNKIYWIKHFRSENVFINLFHIENVLDNMYLFI